MSEKFPLSRLVCCEPDGNEGVTWDLELGNEVVTKDNEVVTMDIRGES